MARSILWAGLFAAIGAGALAVPAAAQFGSIFAPPRPPAAVPGGQQEQRAPAPYGAPQMPPEEADIDDEPLPPPQRYTPPRVQQGAQQPSQQYRQSPEGYPQPSYPQQGSPGQYRQDAVRSQPLAPPPGAAQPPQQPAGVAPGQIVPPLQQAPDRPPEQARGAPPQPANTAPQPGDEVVVEPPSQKLVNPTAVFAGLDKITGRIISFDADIGETVQFGALRVKTDACYTRPATEAANTDAFVEVDEITLQNEVKRIFSGWMFAASPGLHAVEHPIYDVWLTDCKGPEQPVTAQNEPVKPAPPPAQQQQPKRQQPRPQPPVQQPVQQRQPVPPPPGGFR